MQEEGPKEVQTPKVIQPPAGKNSVKETPSLLRRKPVAEGESNEPSRTVTQKRDVPFDEEALKAAWQAFDGSGVNVGELGKRILNREVKKAGENDIVVMLTSQLEVSFLEPFEADLVQFLRDHLKNDHISLQKEIAEIEVTNKLYTSKDIYDYMVKENPKLQELKDRLGLDFDY